MKNKKLILVCISLLFAFLLLGSYVSAKVADNNKISFFESINNFFKFTGNQIAEENFVEIDLSELKLSDDKPDSKIQEIQIQEGINYERQEDFIVFRGEGTIKTQVGSKNQVGKFYGYSLSEDGSLAIDYLTGEVEEVKNLKLAGEINLGQELDKSPPNIRGFPDGAILSYSKEKGFGFLEDKEFLEINLDGETMKIENGQNFDIFYADGQIQSLKFYTTSDTSLEIFEGKYSFRMDDRVLMNKHVLNSPKISVEKFPSFGETNFETQVEGTIYKVPGIAFESEELVFRKGTLEKIGFNEEKTFKGIVAIDEKGHVSVPASFTTEIKNEFKIDFPTVKEGTNKPGIAESVYIFGDENVAKSSGRKNYVSASKNLFVNNDGGGKSGEGFEIDLVAENPWIPEMKLGDRVKIITDTTKTGFLNLEPSDQDFAPYAYSVGEGITIVNDGNEFLWKNPYEYISIRDLKTEYANNPGVNMHIITKSDVENSWSVGALAVDDGKTIYFDTTDKSTENFQSEYNKIGREAILKEKPVLSPESLVQGRVRQDTAKFLEDPEAEMIARDMAKNINDIQNFQRQTIPEWREKVGEEYYQGTLASHDLNDPSKLDNYIIQKGNIFFKSNEVKDYQEYETAIIKYQKNRQDLIDAEIIGYNDVFFPDYLGLGEKNAINQIMSSQNLEYNLAMEVYLRDHDLLIGSRALIREPKFKTLSIWKINYGAKDMREEFQEIKK